MNPQQKLIATLGLMLILLVLWSSYNTALKAILFNSSNAFGSTGGIVPAPTPVPPGETTPPEPINPSSPFGPPELGPGSDIPALPPVDVSYTQTPNSTNSTLLYTV